MLMMVVMTVTCSLESMARQVRTATQRIERTPTVWHQVITLSPHIIIIKQQFGDCVCQINAHPALTCSPAILEQGGEEETAEKVFSSAQCCESNEKEEMNKPFWSQNFNNLLLCLLLLQNQHNTCCIQNKDWIPWFFLLVLMVWRIPAEQFCPANDPGFCLRVDRVHGWISRIVMLSMIFMSVVQTITAKGPSPSYWRGTLRWRQSLPALIRPKQPTIWTTSHIINVIGLLVKSTLRSQRWCW